MSVEDFTDRFSVTTPEELASVLGRRSPSGFNSFWLSHDSRFPAISVLVKDQLAYLHYFPKERHPGFHSISDPPVCREEFFEFRLDSSNRSQSIMGEAVVPFEVALAVAAAFMNVPVQPSGVEWTEL